MMRGDKPEHWLESLEPREGRWRAAVWKQVDSEIGQWGATGAFPKGKGEEP